jgi:hypothetical protein
VFAVAAVAVRLPIACCVQIHEKYDLKGSWIDRHTSDPKGIKKDSDLFRKLLLHDSTRASFLAAITADAQFLCANNIMDYSLLLGVHYMQHRLPAPAPAPAHVAVPRSSTEAKDGTAAATAPAPFFQTDDGGVRARVIEGPGQYHMGIIDVLQDWNTNKKCERCAKVYLRCKAKHGISVMRDGNGNASSSSCTCAPALRGCADRCPCCLLSTCCSRRPFLPPSTRPVSLRRWRRSRQATGRTTANAPPPRAWTTPPVAVPVAVLQRHTRLVHPALQRCRPPPHRTSKPPVAVGPLSPSRLVARPSTAVAAAAWRVAA